MATSKDMNSCPYQGVINLRFGDEKVRKQKMLELFVVYYYT